MIELKDLEFRRYEEKQCISFVYDVLVDVNDRQDRLRFCFEKVDGDTWHVTVIEPEEVNNNRLIAFKFSLPKSTMTLVMICAFGIQAYRQLNQRSLNWLSTVDFTIADLVEDMKG